MKRWAAWLGIPLVVVIAAMWRIAHDPGNAARGAPAATTVGDPQAAPTEPASAIPASAAARAALPGPGARAAPGTASASGSLSNDPPAVAAAVTPSPAPRAGPGPAAAPPRRAAPGGGSGSDDDAPTDKLVDRTGWGDPAVGKQLNREFMPLASECIEQAKARTPGLRGRLVVQLKLAPGENGRTVVVAATPRQDSEIADPELLECIRESSFSLEALRAPRDFDITMPIGLDGP